MVPIAVAALGGSQFQAQLANALAASRAGVDLRRCGRASIAASVASSDVALVVAELYDALGNSTLPALLALKQRHESLPLLVSVSLVAEDMRSLVRAITAGLEATWILRDVDDLARAVVRAIRERADLGAAASLLQTIWPAISPEVRPFFAVAAVGASRPITTLDAARTLGLAVRTLEGQLKRAQLPPPHRVLGWCRALHATWLFDRLGRKPKQVVNELSFPSISALYNLLNHFTVPRPGALLAEGGFEETLRRFASDLYR